MANGITFIKSNMGTIGSTAAGAGIGLGAGYFLGKKSGSKKRKHAKSKKRKSSSHSSSHKRRRRTPRTAGKRKDRSTKRIRYTKTGQPYVILRSGKARFIKKRGAKSAHKRKGGRY